MRTPTVILMTVCLPAALGLPVPVAQVSQVGGSDGGVTAPPASRGFQLDPASAGIGSVAGTGSGALGLHLLTNGDNVWNRQRVQQLEKERPTLMQENYDMGREHEAADRAAPGQKMKECFDYMVSEHCVLSSPCRRSMAASGNDSTYSTLQVEYSAADPKPCCPYIAALLHRLPNVKRPAVEAQVVG